MLVVEAGASATGSGEYKRIRSPTASDNSTFMGLGGKVFSESCSKESPVIPSRPTYRTRCRLPSRSMIVMSGASNSDPPKFIKARGDGRAGGVVAEGLVGG